MAAKEKKLKRETATVNFGRSEAEEATNQTTANILTTKMQKEKGNRRRAFTLILQVK